MSAIEISIESFLVISMRKNMTLQGLIAHGITFTSLMAQSFHLVEFQGFLEKAGGENRTRIISLEG